MRLRREFVAGVVALSSWGCSGTDKIDASSAKADGNVPSASDATTPSTPESSPTENALLDAGASHPQQAPVLDARVLAERACSCVIGTGCGLGPRSGGVGLACLDSGAWGEPYEQRSDCPAVKDLELPCSTFGKYCAYGSGSCDGGLDWFFCNASVWTPIPAQQLCATDCPSTFPVDGGACETEAVACEWPTACGSSQIAVCADMRWSLTTNPCACGDPSNLVLGHPCFVSGMACLRVGDAWTDLFTCQSGTWRQTVSYLGGPSCPTSEPAANDACGDGASCEWSNPCGSFDWGDCIGGVWSKSPSPCPGTALTSCTAGTPCEPRVKCSTGCSGDAGGPLVDCSCGSDGALHCSSMPCPVGPVTR